MDVGSVVLTILEYILSVGVALHEVGEDLFTDRDIFGEIDYEPPDKRLFTSFQPKGIPSLGKSAIVRQKADKLIDHSDVDPWLLHCLYMIHVFLVPILYFLIVVLILYAGKDLLLVEVINWQDIGGQCMLFFI